MPLLGIESVLYGVEDLAAGRQFWTDFGLRLVGEAGGAITFATTEGATIVLRSNDDPSLPPAPIAGPTVREVTWAVDSQANFDVLVDELSRDQHLTIGADGAAHGVDPAGYAIALQVTRQRATQEAPTTYNAPGHNSRVGRRAKVYAQACPAHLAHVVFLAPQLEELRDFYVARLGFQLTDQYPDRGYFLRCAGANDHHNLFLLNQGDAKGFHHIAFDVRDVHELFGGGLFMDSGGWKTHLGPGRHPISSAYFWYFRNPCGGAAEYDFDGDCVDESWVPRAWPSTPASFAEWAFPAGATRYAGAQTKVERP